MCIRDSVWAIQELRPRRERHGTCPGFLDHLQVEEIAASCPLSVLSELAYTSGASSRTGEVAVSVERQAFSGEWRRHHPWWLARFFRFFVRNACQAFLAI